MGTSKASTHVPEDFVEVLLRPVGTWRFLTPLDTIADGDLYRMLQLDVLLNEYQASWTMLQKGDPLIGWNATEWLESYEIIRPMEEQSATVPLFPSDTRE